MSQAILRRQKVIGDAIKAKYERFLQTAVERKNRSFLEEKLNILNLDWRDFEDNHRILQEATDIDGGHDYFKKAYFEAVQTEYQEFIVEIREMISALDKANPRTAPETILPQPTYEFPKNPMDEDFIDTASGDNIFKNGTQLNLENLFKAASIHNSKNASMDSSEATAENKAFQVIFASLEELMNIWKEEMLGTSSTPKLEEDEIDVLRELILGKWNTVKTMQDVLACEKGYNPQTFLKLEQQMVPILIQERKYKKTHDQGNRQQVVVQSSAKIPKLNIPIFNGDHIKWNSFKELFLRMIGRKNDLDGCEKLAYLQGQLEGEPARLIATLPLVNASYNTAWNILSERFDNTHVIVSKLFSKLLKGEQMKKFSIESMKETMDRIRECVDTLINMKFEMNDTLNYVLYYLVESQVDRPTLSLYENVLAPSANPRRYDDLMRFLKQRIQNLSAKGEAPQKSHPKNNNGYKKEKVTNVSTSLVVSSSPKAIPKASIQKKATTCGSCKENHFIHQCPVFSAMSPEERYRKIRDWRRCINCLREGHTVKTCKSRACSTCNKKHNTLLHDDKKIQKTKIEKANALVGSAVHNEGFKHVFLATAIIDIHDVNGTPVKARALLDSGSQINMMTEKMHKKLGLDHLPASMKVSGIGTSETESTKRTTVKIISRISGYETHLELFVIKQITTCQPAHKIETNDWKIPKNIALADPLFNVPAPVDIVIGGELFFKLISIGIISIGKTLPDLQNTVFGWVVAGKVLGIERNQAFVGISTMKSLEHEVKQFWKIEEKHQDENPMTQLEQNCVTNEMADSS